LTPQRAGDVAASFQQAVVDVLLEKSRQALRRTGIVASRWAVASQRTVRFARAQTHDG
jgi:tRNA A37 threonylcarbamoyltransferase TsaD